MYFKLRFDLGVWIEDSFDWEQFFSPVQYENIDLTPLNKSYGSINYKIDVACVHKVLSCSNIIYKLNFLLQFSGSFNLFTSIRSMFLSCTCLITVVNITYWQPKEVSTVQLLFDKTIFEIDFAFYQLFNNGNLICICSYMTCDI